MNSRKLVEKPCFLRLCVTYISADVCCYPYTQVLPAGVELMFNLDSVYNDPDIFDNVHEFNPERFLTGDVTKKKACIEAAFGLGQSSLTF